MMLSCLVTKRRLAPRCARARASDRGSAFAAAVRMVVRVHDGTADGGTDAHVALAAGFAEHDVGEVDVADLTDRSLAAEGDEPDLTAGETYLSVLAFLSHELSGVAGAADELSALAGEQLDAVDHRADGDVLEGDGVADLDIGALAGNDGINSVL